MAEGVSAFPQEVTPQMVLNFLNGRAEINVLSCINGGNIVCVDICMACDIGHPDLIVKKVRYGTDNISVGPAMCRQEAVLAIEKGIEVVQEQVQKGVSLLATGEMGIGNTTPSSAILAVYSNKPVEALVGRGTGINDKGLNLKRRVIQLKQLPG